MIPPIEEQTCILTLQAARPGGVPTVVDWWHTFLTEWGHQATVLYAAYEEEPISYIERLRRTFHTWNTHIQAEFAIRTLASAAPPVPIWLFYLVPQWLLGSVFSRFDQIVFAGGPIHAAIAPVLRGFPVIIWMGTLYDDELSGKAAVGDKWAEEILKSRFLPILGWQETFVLHHAPRILVQSPYTLGRIAEKFPEIHKKLDLVMVPVDTDIFVPLLEESKSAQRYVLNISRINDPRKNIPLLLEAFSLVASIESDLYLILAGDDPEQSLINYCNQLGIRDRVVFRGQVSKDDLVRLYQNAELMVISSAQEGLGIAMLEAISCGTPVVATDCGGPEGIVIEDITGCIVTNYDVNKLAGAITKLLQNPAKLKRLRASCREFALQNWSKTVIEQKLRSHFISVFPNSIAAHQYLENENGYSKALVKLNQVQKNNRPQEILALLWCVLIVAAYIQHQAILHWNAIQSSILDPLLNILQ